MQKRIQGLSVTIAFLVIGVVEFQEDHGEN
jgi:hypothetical protein